MKNFIFVIESLLICLTGISLVFTVWVENFPLNPRVYIFAVFAKRSTPGKRQMTLTDSRDRYHMLAALDNGINVTFDS